MEIEMSDRKNTQTAQGPTMNLSDIYFILFKHKWKILFFSVAGVIAAIALFFLKPPMYTSACKVYIPNIVEAKSPLPGQVHSVDDRGDNIMGSEVEILSSGDVALNVVSRFGAANIVPPVEGINITNAAAAFVKKNIASSPIKKSDVMLIVFQHPDKTKVKPLLQAVLDAYKEQHRKAHDKLAGADTFFAAQIAENQRELNSVTAQLNEIQQKTHIGPVDDAKKANAARAARLQDELITAQASLAEHEAAYKKMTGSSATSASANNGTNNAPEIPKAKITEYRNACMTLEELLSQQADLLTWCTTNNVLVTDKQKQIDDAQNLKAGMEAKYARIETLAAAQPVVASASPTGPVVDPATEAIQVDAFRARVNFLTSQLAQVRQDEDIVETYEGTINELQRKKDGYEASIRDFNAKLSEAHINTDLDNAKYSSISVVQEPSNAYRDMAALYKMLGMVVGVGIAFGLGLAFLLEMYLDPTIKRPNEVEARLHVPLFLSIPDKRNGHALPPANQKLLAAPATNGNGNGNGESVPNMAVAPRNGATALWDANHELRPYFEALRDRLVNYFDLNNLTHNPKIVAVTSCGEGAGVSTVAAGLAATLSETGEGNVLLVDMNNGKNAAALDFHKGKPALNISEVLDTPRRAEAMVQDNLYVVSHGNDNDKGQGILPKQFAYLVPKLRASDYDYIIFDMPPISQISVTSKLARLMDVNLLVVESEKTGREVAKQASDMLTGSKAKVGVVLNKKRTYVPQWLHQEL
jgi:succinoglycan biosynthesis transport protein ExoP